MTAVLLLSGALTIFDLRLATAARCGLVADLPGPGVAPEVGQSFSNACARRERPHCGKVVGLFLANPGVRLSQLLFSQGFGVRRECEGLVLGGHVAIGGRVRDDPFLEVDPEGLVFTVRGEAWPFRAKALVLLHKPAGHECSQKPKHHPSVMSLLPSPLRVRGLQPVGRLDEDTTGLLLLTDDGALIHRLSSPKKHVPKVYEIETTEPVTAAQIDALRGGVVLRDDPLPVRAADCEQTGAQSIRMTLREGKYHQVKRMVAAAGNTVRRLHRSEYGVLRLPADLAPGRWRWLPGPEAVLGAG